MRKRTTAVLLTGIALAAALWLGRGLLSHRALAAVLTSPAPTGDAMTEFVATAHDPIASLHQLWDTQKIPQRLFVLDFIREHSRTDPSFWQKSRPLALAALTLADTQLQEDSLQLLAAQHDPESLPRAKSYLTSPDSAVRMAGLMQLNNQNDPQWASAFAHLLDDADPSVQTIAAAALKKLTGEDFGTHLAADTQPAGIAQWKSWWQSHHGDYPAYAPAMPPADASPGLPFPFALPDMQGHTVHLSDFHGKVVLLDFWATWCPSCVGELESLQALQAAHPDDLVLLGINLDGVSDNDDHDPPPDAAALAKIHADVQHAIDLAHLTYPTLLDPRGTVLGAYAAGSLPTSVLIGADGTVKRRLLGARTRPAWEALIAAAR